MSKVNVKETLELLEALGELGKVGKAIAKDGIGAEDLVQLGALAANFNTLVEGFTGMEKLAEELKDLDESEVLEIIGSIYAQAEKINAVK